jgi:hypothetical protein
MTLQEAAEEDERGGDGFNFAAFKSLCLMLEANGRKSLPVIIKALRATGKATA